MPVIPNNVDWSATAAWIAVIISVTGSIIGPIATALITSHHQCKLRELDIKRESVLKKQQIIIDCMSASSACIASPSNDALDHFGASYFPVYSYLPPDLWPVFDDFYSTLANYQYKEAKAKIQSIMHPLADLLTEISQEPPKQ